MTKNNEDAKQFAEVQYEYANYITNKLKTVFSFSEWHEQTYGRSLTKDEIDFSIENIRDICVDEVEDYVMHINGY